MFKNPPLSDEEICRKFEITTNHIGFATAKALSLNRPDRGISDWPSLRCPHCYYEFRIFKWHVDMIAIKSDDAIVCNGCERLIYVEHVEWGDDHETHQSLTLCTHPQE
ncbi:hypothetical protein SAMN05444166_4169 [Singulisphaera sp. GP187]|uniref:hypothetical protein n=1 Tax=Singulisphaera sp. GP187 TaxID=1882752 RepID=UPI00092988A9|nr:hypothetical protein [Singulisphaera sp. GP187]SIO37143.1 hypothetical protein SAMN05444166_4169 [Singulisphaera sp. GP187]